MLLITLKICCWKLEVKYEHLFTAMRLSYTFRYYYIRTYVGSYMYAFCPKPNDMIADDEWCDFPTIVDSSCFLLCQFHHQTAQFPTTTKYARTTYAARS